MKKFAAAIVSFALAAVFTLETRAQFGADLVRQFSSQLSTLPVFAGRKVVAAQQSDGAIILTLDGNAPSVTAFPNAASKSGYAYALSISGGSFALPGAALLQGVKLPQATFIYADAPAALRIADLPSPVRNALRQASPGGLPDSLTIAKGVSAFLEADFSASAAGSFLQQQLGLNTGVVAFTGTVPESVFSGQLGRTATAGQAANAPAGFNLTATIGQLALNGVSSDVMSMPGQTILQLASDSNGLALKAAANVQVMMAGQTLPVALAMQGRVRNKTVVGRIDGQVQGNATVSFAGLSVSGLTVAADNTGSGWALSFGGNASLNGKTLAATLAYAASQNGGSGEFQARVTTGLTLADLVPALDKVPGLSTLTLQNVAFGGRQVSASLASKTHTYDLALHPDSSGAMVAVIKADELNLAEAIPGAATSFLNNLDIVNPILLVEPGREAREFSLAGLPAELVRALEQVGIRNSMRLQPGLNVFATLDPTKSAAAGTLAQIGLDKPLPLKGAIDPRILADLLSHARGSQARVSGGSDLAKIDLSVPLPALNLPGMPQEGLFKLPTLRITRGQPAATATATAATATPAPAGAAPAGTAAAPASSGIKVAIASEFDLSIAGSRVSFPGELTFAQRQGSRVPDLQFAGANTTGWPAAFGLNWLQIRSLQANIALAATAQGGQAFSFAMNGVTDLGSSKNIPLAINLAVANGRIGGAEFKLANRLALKDLPPISALPVVSKVALKNLDIKIAGLGNDRNLSLSGAVDTADIFSFEGLKFSTGSFTATEKGSDWAIALTGSGSLNAKPVQIDARFDSAAAAKEYAATLTGNIRLSDLAGSYATALDTLAVQQIAITGDKLDAKLSLGQEPLDIALFKTGAAGHRYLSVTAGTLDLAKTIPGIGAAFQGAVLKDVSVLVAKKGAAQSGVPASALPTALAKAVTDVAGGSLDIKDGVTILAQLDVSGAGPAKQVFDTLSVPNVIPIKGTVDPSMIAAAYQSAGRAGQNAGQAAGQGAAAARAALANLDLQAPVGAISLPGLPAGSGFSDMVFRISGQNPNPAPGTSATGLFASFAGTLSFSEGGGKPALTAPGSISFSGSGGNMAINFAGAVAGGWQSPFGLSWLHVDDLTLTAGISSTGGSRGAKLDFNGTADLGKATNLKLAIAVDAANGQLNSGDLTFTGGLKMSDLPALASLPRADGFQLDGFKLTAARQGTAWDETITAAFKAGGMVDFPGFALNSGNFTAKKAPDGWSLDATATATLNGKAVNVTAELTKDAGGAAPDYTVTVTDDLTVANLLGTANAIPGLNEFAIKQVKLSRAQVAARMTYKTEEVDVLFYRPDPQKKVHVALALSNFNLGDNIPGASSTPLDDISFSNLALVIVPQGGTTGSMPTSSLPAILSAKAAALAGSTVTLGTGANIFAELDVKGGSGLADVFGTLGISKGIPIVGSVDPRMLASGRSQGAAPAGAGNAASSWISSLNLGGALPDLKVPGLTAGSGFQQSKINISGKGGLAVSIGTTFVFAEESSTLRAPGNFSFTRSGGNTAVAFAATVPDGWSAPFGQSWLHITNLSLNGNMTGSGTNRALKLDFAGQASLGKSAPLKLAIDLQIANAQVSAANLDFTGGLKMSDLPPLSALPRADGFQLNGFKLAMARQGTAWDETITAAFTSGGMVDFPGFALNGGDFTAKKNAEGWSLDANAKATLQGKAVNVTAELVKDAGNGAPDYTVTIADDLTVAGLIGSGNSIPGLDDFAIKQVKLTRSQVGAVMTYKTEEVDILFYRPGPQSKVHVALALSDFNLGDSIPGASSTLLSDVGFSDMALVIVPQGGVTGAMQTANLPAIVSAKAKAVAGDAVTLGTGANIFAQMDIKASSSLGQALGALGISKEVPIVGSVDPRVLASGRTGSSSAGGAAASWASSLNLSGTLPSITIPGLPDKSGFQSPKVKISGQGGFSLSIDTTMVFAEGKNSLQAPGSFSFTRSGGNTDVAFAGKVQGGWDGPFGLTWLHLNNLALNASLTGTGTTRDIKLSFAGAATGLGKAPLQVAAALEVQNRQLSNASLDFTGALTMADLPALKALPRASGFEMDGFKLAAKNQGGNWEPTITAAFKSAKMVDFPGFTLNGGSFTAAKTAADWSFDAKANATLQNKPVSVTAELVKNAGDGTPDYTVTITDALTISQLLGAGNSIPGLDDFSITEVKLTRLQVGAKMKYKTEEVDILVYHPDPQKKAHIALALSNFNLGDSIPGASGTPLTDISFADMALVVVPKDGVVGAVKSTALPAIVADKVKAVAGETVTLTNGANIFSMFEAKSGSSLGDVMGSLGISKSIPITGAVDPRFLSASGSGGGSGGGSGASSWLSSLNLTGSLPNITIPGIPDGIGFHTPKLNISSKNNQPTISIPTTFGFKVGSANLSLPGEFDFTKHTTGSEISFKGSGGDWHAPLDIPWLSLTGLTVDFDLKSPTGGSRELALSLSGNVGLGKKTALPADVAFTIDGGKLSSGEVRIASQIDLSDIPVLKGIPYASKFGLKDLVISTAGIGAGAILDGKVFNTALINAPGPNGTSGWTMILERDGKTLGDLIPFDKTGILKKMPLTHSLFMLSESGLQLNPAGLPDFARPLLKPILDIHPGATTVTDGLTLAAVFDPSASDDAKKAFGKLGLGSATFIMGELGGIFGGTPLVKIEAFLPKFGKPGGLPKFMHWPESVQPAFFVTLTEEAVEVGIEVDMQVKAGDDQLIFATKVEMEVNEADVTFDIEGEMDGKWEKPFSIKALTLANVALKAGVSPDGSVKLGFKGTTTIGPETIQMAADIEPDPELLGVPKSIAFAGAITSLGVVEIAELIEAIAGKNDKFKADNIPGFELHNVKLAFATPGAEDPDLGIINAGFAAQGSLSFMDHNLGNALLSISETAGLAMKGAIADMDLGPLKLQNNNIDVAIGPTSDPYFKVNGNVDFLGLKESVAVQFVIPAKVMFEMDSDFGLLGKGKLLVEGVGYDVRTGKATNPDFLINGEIQHSDFAGWLEKTVKGQVDAVLADVKAAFQVAEQAVKDAQAKVDGLDATVQKERAIVRAERNRAESAINAAEARVNELQGDADDARSHRNHCHWYQLACKAKYEAEYLAYEAAKTVADGVLDAARKAVDTIPVDLDPRVAGPLAAEDVALAALKAAQLAIEGVEKLDDFAQRIVDSAINGLQGAKPIVINDVAFSGSLSGSIKNDEPWLLNMDYAIFNQPIKGSFVFKLKDPAYDAKELGYVGLQILNFVVEKGLKDIPGPIADKFRESVATLMNDLDTSNQAEMAKHQKEFAAVTQRQADLQKAMEARDEEVTKTLQTSIKSSLDVAPPSFRLEGTLLEVGHSGLCLTAAGNAVLQQPCNEGDPAQRWETELLDAGYVFIKSGPLCLIPSGALGNLNVPLIINACQRGDQNMHWRVVSHDPQFYNLANRKTQKCVHFPDPSATPGKAPSQWAPCDGSDAQAFQPLKQAKPVYHAKLPLASQRSGLCVGSYDFGRQPHPFLSLNIKFRPVFAIACDVLADSEKAPWAAGMALNYVETRLEDGDYVKITDYIGNCIFPLDGRAGSPLVSRPCDHSNDMFWQKLPTPGGMQLRNLSSKLCFDIVPNPGNRTQWMAAQTMCGGTSNQVVDFAIPPSPAAWMATDASHAALPPKKVAWTGVVGRAIDIGVGANGAVWMVGTDRNLYQWQNDRWTPSGAAVKNAAALDVGPNGEIWFVSADEDIISGNGRSWVKRPGKAIDIGIGANGEVWMTGRDKKLYRWNGSAWGVVAAPADAMLVDVGPGGEVLFVSTEKRVYAGNGKQWRALPGAAIDVSFGADGTAWMIDDKHEVNRWSGQAWVVEPGGSALRISGGPSDNPWMVATNNHIFEDTGVRPPSPLAAFDASQGVVDPQTRQPETAFLCRVSAPASGPAADAGLKAESWIGQVDRLGDCAIPGDDGRVQRAKTFEVLKSVAKPKWASFGGPVAPFDAVHAARKGLDLRYACRTIYQNQVRLGSAVDGICRFADGETVATASGFEYLLSE
ncbi:tectonin domain-containing protein [Ferrovibrio sp.]|uniref:tectonin domain-containing protein n=1 Tax=Ferrovibrio sp. TaxID=1917215 RepID=UPI0035B3889A